MRKTPLTCGLAAGVLALAGCGMSGADSTSTATETDASIVIDEPFGPASGWDLATDDAYVLTKAGCLETLVRYQLDGSLQPMLATSWQQTSATQWQFTLRDGVKFQDGTALDAQVVADDLARLLKAKTPAKAFSPKVVTGVSAVDAKTVRVTTTSADVLMPYRLANPNTGILAASAFSGDTVKPEQACTGPFTLTTEIPQQAIDLTRNDTYWGGKPKIAKAEIRFISDGAARATQVRSGEAQIAKRLPVASVQALNGNTDVKVTTTQLTRTTELMLNNKKAPFDNVKVRQAIQAAIDVKAINEGVYGGGNRPAIGPFAGTEPWAPKDATPVPVDTAKATSLLSQAGVNPASIKVTLLAYTEGPQFADLAAVIQQQLKAIGITATIKTGQYASMEAGLLSGDFDMALLSRNHLGDVADPAGFLTADYSCDGAYNISHFCDPSVDALIAKASSAADATARYALYAQIATQLQTRAVDVFLVHEAQSDAVASTVGDFTIHPYYTLTADLSLTSKG